MFVYNIFRESTCSEECGTIHLGTFNGNVRFFIILRLMKIILGEIWFFSESIFLDVFRHSWPHSFFLVGLFHFVSVLHSTSEDSLVLKVYSSVHETAFGSFHGKMVLTIVSFTYSFETTSSSNIFTQQDFGQVTCHSYSGSRVQTSGFS